MLDETFFVVFKHCAYCTMMNRKVKSAQLLLKLENDFPFGFTNHHVTAPAQCLKISKKVAFNIASEANYVYILSGQKLIKNAKNGRFGKFLKI